MLGFVSNCTIVLYPYEWVHDSLDILKRCSTYLCRLSKIKLREEQDTAIGHIDFFQKIITAAIFESHLSIIVPDSDTNMFQRIPFQSHVEIDQLSFIVANVDVKIIETLPDKPLWGRAKLPRRPTTGRGTVKSVFSSFHPLLVDSMVILSAATNVRNRKADLQGICILHHPAESGE